MRDLRESAASLSFGALEEFRLRRNLPFHLAGDFVSLFRDRRFRLTGRRLKSDSNHADQLSRRIVQRQGNIEAIFLFFHKWLPRLHRLHIVLLAFFSNVTLVGRGNSDASVTSSGGNADFI